MLIFDSKQDTLHPERASSPHGFANRILGITEEFFTKPNLPYTLSNRQHIFLSWYEKIDILSLCFNAAFHHQRWKIHLAQRGKLSIIENRNKKTEATR